MEAVATAIVPAAERGLGLAEKLLEGVEPAKFARLASPGGQVIQANHAAFIYGHLSLYPARIMQAAGREDAAIFEREGWNDLFGAGCECRDDPEGTIYPSMSEITEACLPAYKKVIEQVKGWPDAAFTKPHALGGRYAEVFATLGMLTNFMLLGHTMMHFGQMSTWRRAMGLGSVMRG
ncbi:MAG: DinB family protein [Phycisphaeraceae bacterium]|nr:MAG: DinB family protein [Phycisphaeraceae bacterium]